MRRLLTVFVLAALALTAAAQQQVPTLEKGFQAEKVYQLNGLDNVNVFNGNLVIAIPIGMSYPLDGGLSYQLTLSYNSKMWDLLEVGPKVHAIPSGRSNAGIGWVLGMGRLVLQSDPTNGGGSDVYEAPDGGDHRFDSVEASGAGFIRTTDGSNLRMRQLSASTRAIEFPDGIVREFQIAGTSATLTKIRGPRGSQSVDIAYPTPDARCPGAQSMWTISDSFSRTHVVCFKNHSVDNVLRPMVDSVILAGPAASLSSPNTPQLATYKFIYEDSVPMNAPVADNDYASGTWSRDHTVPLLRSIQLPSTAVDDTPVYAFQYRPEGSPLPAGPITQLTLPTGGKIAYEYGDYIIPSLQICANVTAYGEGFGAVTSGVTRRTLTPAVPAGETPAPQVWRYEGERKRLGTPISAYTSATNCSAGQLENPSTYVPLYDLFQVRITDPAGNQTVSHFSIWPRDADRPNPGISPAGVSWLHYGYPYGAKAADGLYLSQEYFDCQSGTCIVKRSNWVRHEADGTSSIPVTEPMAPHRQVEQRTSYHDDPAGCSANGGTPPCAWTRSVSSDWDLYGHYRTMTMSGTLNTGGIPEQRTSTTTFNKTNGVQRSIAAADPWILDTYESVTTTDDAGTVVEQACFDPLTGFLKARRQLSGTSPVASDLVAVYHMDPATGNLDTESYYGGDKTALTTNSIGNQARLCDAIAGVAGQPAYRLSHTWQYGRPATSQYANTNILVNDATIDRSGVVLTARDTAGLQTAYTYDANGRIIAIQPPAGPVTSYVYKSATVVNGSLTRPAQVHETTVSSSVGTVEREYHYDSFGRLWRENKTAPPQSGSTPIWTVREILYDLMDRKLSVSETVQVTSPGTITFHPAQKSLLGPYDAFGRPKQVTATDGSVTTFAYTGARSTSRTSEGGGVVPIPVTIVEDYDSFGRLLKVKESSGPTGGIVTTTYTYDTGNHLDSVHMAGTEGVVQNREFGYDGRGFLRFEAQPESGTARYTYDARGHVLSKDQAGALTQFDLQFTYDSAERLTLLEGRNPDDLSSFRRIKEFAFGTANDVGSSPPNYAKGKLTLARRYNYPPPNKPAQGVLRVDETYRYLDGAGHRTHRTTQLAWQLGTAAPWDTFRTIEQSMTYNDMGAPASVVYPVCIACGIPQTANTGSFRTTSLGYENGALKSVSGFVSGITYWPNGMRMNLIHSNAIADTQTVDGSGMPRPLSLSSGLYNSCTAPTITQTSPDGSVSSASPSITLSVTVTGTAPFTYQWYNADTGNPIAGATSSTYPASPSVTTRYHVEITNACRTGTSGNIRVVVSECLVPSITSATATRNANGSFTLSATANGKQPLTFSWNKPDGGLLGVGATQQTEPLTLTAPYTVTVTNSCAGTGVTQTVWATVVPEVPPSMTATASGSQIIVSWGSAAGATGYRVERRDPSGGWSTIATTGSTTTQFVDPSVPPNTTRVYRVMARGPNNGESAPTLPDVATTVAFTAAQASAKISSTPFEQLLTALNAVRAAAGWAPVTWDDILSDRDPAPGNSMPVSAQQLVSLRARLNEAMHALGVPVNGWTDSDPRQKRISASHINEIQGRVK